MRISVWLQICNTKLIGKLQFYNTYQVSVKNTYDLINSKS